MSNKNITNSPDTILLELELLKNNFPQFFSEGKLDFNAFKSYFEKEIVNDKEFYHFEWTWKQESKMLANKPTKNTLLPDKSKSVEWDKTENVFIEWDNLEVLKLLLNQYYNQVKMIYIDPPYNKDKDFIYKDTWKDNLDSYLTQTNQKDDNWETVSEKETSWRRHSNWLNMIYPRLLLARKLLKEEGVIFVSIDDDEIHNLKKVMDEVFGEENFIWIFIINSSPSAIDYGHMAKQHEYALFYAKNIFETETYQLEEKDKEFKYEDKVWPFNIYPLYHWNVAFNPSTRPNLYYPFYLNPSNKIENDFYEIGLEKKDWWVEVFPVISQKDNIQHVWRWWREKASKDLNKEIIWYLSNSWEYRVVQKTRHTWKVIRSIQMDQTVSSRRGTWEVESLFGSKVFNFPKSVDLLRYFCSVGMNKDDIVLDFFAWSWTTAHSIMQLNSEDGWNRKFICVQLPESIDANAIAYQKGFRHISDITRERIKRAWEKIKKETSNKDIDIWFKSFKLDTSNFRYLQEYYEINKDTDIDQLEIQLEKEVEESWLMEWRQFLDIVYELIVRDWYNFNSKIEQLDNWIYKITDWNKYFYLQLEALSDEIVKEFIKLNLNSNSITYYALEDKLLESQRITLSTYFKLINL